MAENGGFGNCKKCGTYGPLDKDGVCRTCILYPKPNIGEKQAEWRISKLRKKDEDE